MTGAEPNVERQELGERVLGLIGGYRMGAALDAHGPVHENAPGGSAAGPRPRGRRAPHRR